MSSQTKIYIVTKRVKSFRSFENLPGMGIMHASFVCLCEFNSFIFAKNAPNCSYYNLPLMKGKESYRLLATAIRTNRMEKNANEGYIGHFTSLV